MTPQSTQAAKPERCQCTGCKKSFLAEEFGNRKDGRPNTRCPNCRAAQASSAGTIGHRKAVNEEQRDMKALRVVERYVGLPWKEWTTPKGRALEEKFFRKKGLMFEELWTERMIRLGSRWDRMMAARERIAARKILAGQAPVVPPEPTNPTRGKRYGDQFSLFEVAA